MELKQYIKLLKDNSVLIAIVITVGAICGFYYATKSPSGYQAERSYFIAINQSANSSQGQLSVSDPSNYYAQERARNFTDTAVAILQSEDFENEIGGNGEKISIHKVAPQVIKISVISQDSNNAAISVEKVTNHFNVKVLTLNNQVQPIELRAIGKPPQAQFVAASKKIYILIGTFLGFITAIIVISLKQYFKL